MDIKIEKIESLNEENISTLKNILSSQRWDFHSSPIVTSDKILDNINSGYYLNKDIVTFLIKSGEEYIGVMRLFDLGDDWEDDETPMFDIRILNSYRKKGVGEYSLKFLTDFVFNTYPNKWRFEGTTRADNIAMRKLFEKCGFVKEAHYRQAWPDESGKKYDCTGYGILRSDWENNEITVVRFNS
ncbi:MAG TPA: GNAT family protein [Ignavibacteria bacterium]|nr:GNAT family protein [Ignavibacteria bacterium]